MSNDEENRAFLSFFAQEEETLQYDDTESKLVQALEKKQNKEVEEEKKKDTIGSYHGHYGGGKQQDLQNHHQHRRRNSNTHLHAKLPFLMKQMSSKNLRKNLYEMEGNENNDNDNDNDNDIMNDNNNTNNLMTMEHNLKQSDHGIELSSSTPSLVVDGNDTSITGSFNDPITGIRHRPTMPERGILKRNTSSGNNSLRSNSRNTNYYNQAVSGTMGSGSSNGPKPPKYANHGILSRRGVKHRRNRSSTETFFDFTDQLALASGESRPTMAGMPLLNEEGNNNDNDSISTNGSYNNNNNSNPEQQQHRQQEDAAVIDFDFADVETPLLSSESSSFRRKTLIKRARYTRLFSGFISLLGPYDIIDSTKYFIIAIVPPFILLPIGVSAILFYCFGNPGIGFLPTKASISWWLIFFTRQVVTLHLAKSTEYMLYVITNRTTIFLRIFGSLMTLLIMQATGWPLLLTSWGIWDLALLHGSHPFQLNWLYFANLALFSSAHNRDHGILDSELYLRVLVSIIIIGLAAAIKRTTVALYLGGRMLQHYKPQLEEVLHDMGLIHEIADLAIETENEGFLSLLNGEIASLKKRKPGFIETVPRFSVSVPTPTNKNKKNNNNNSSSKLKISTSNHGSKSFLPIDDDEEEEHDDDDDSNNSDDDDNNDEYDLTGSDRALRSFSPASNGQKTNNHQVQWSQLKSKVQQRRNTAPVNEDDGAYAVERNSTTPDLRSRLQTVRETRQRQVAANSAAAVPGTGIEKTMMLLDTWQEPEEKKAKEAYPSIHDTLQFRKAMAFMQNDYPFSTSFGLADTRKACVKSSLRVYKRLLKYSLASSTKADNNRKKSNSDDTSVTTNTTSSSSNAGGSTSKDLPFDVIGALAYDENGELIESRARALLRLFLPDKDDRVPETAFVQSIDAIYKKLRYLRASLCNASKIDSVLEDIFNMFFWFLMGIIIMSVLGWNPWPLLVSFSTIIVSFAFAFGPSAAKYIEGLLLIAVRRPYDIGDRIIISQSDSFAVAKPEDSLTWFVQDITLTTTTLRFASTNEVSTVNNSSIANARIVNCSRSKNAIVTIRIKFDVVKATHAKIDLFRSRVEIYLKDRPQKWGTNGLIHFRNNEIALENGYVEYVLRAQHVKPWQDMAHIMMQRGHLIRYCMEVAQKLGIAYTSAPATSLSVQVLQNKSSSTSDNDNPAVENSMGDFAAFGI